MPCRVLSLFPDILLSNVVGIHVKTPFSPWSKTRYSPLHDIDFRNFLINGTVWNFQGILFNPIRALFESSFLAYLLSWIKILKVLKNFWNTLVVKWLLKHAIIEANLEKNQNGIHFQQYKNSGLYQSVYLHMFVKSYIHLFFGLNISQFVYLSVYLSESNLLIYVNDCIW